jgi:hypothetical protein
MSVQKVSPEFSVITSCPLVITPAETVLTYQTASAVYTYHNVNGRSGECFPNDYAFLQVRPPQQPSQCCSNNALASSFNKSVAGSMNHGY